MKRLIMTLTTAISLNCSLGQSPNFILILADDQGWNGTSVQLSSTESGSFSDYYLTPNLEKMALEGAVFSAAYAPSPKCSPSRCSILTGQTTARNQFTNTDNQISTGKKLIEAQTVRVIDNNDQTIAEFLKSVDSNYKTAHYGKWHLYKNGPANHGFDEGDGETENADGDNDPAGGLQDDPKKIYEITDRAMNFMENSKKDNKPFYLQMSHYAVHSTIEYSQTSKSIIDLKTPGSVHGDVAFASMTYDLDRSVGMILDKVSELGIESNTYIFYTSDNGAFDRDSDNFPLSLGKLYLAEGGIRVPMIIKGPGISADKEYSNPVVGYDILPTIAEILDSESQLASDVDGQSFYGLVSGQKYSREKPIFFYSPHYEVAPTKFPEAAIIRGDYKFIVDFDNGTMELFDIQNDVSESNDLSDTYPEMKNELWVVLRDHLKDVSANYPSLNPDFFTSSDNDVDNDGLDDGWEISELLSFAFDGSEDLNGDGITLAEEFLSGKDPLTANSYTAVPDANRFSVVFPNPSSGIVYIQTMNSTVVRQPVIYSIDRSALNVPCTIIDQSMISLDFTNYRRGIYFITYNGETNRVEIL